jgi:hypothetical protein
MIILKQTVDKDKINLMRLSKDLHPIDKNVINENRS